jgi:hypothetical protein
MIDIKRGLTTELSTGSFGFELPGLNLWHIFKAIVLHGLIYLHTKKYMILSYGMLFAALYYAQCKLFYFSEISYSYYQI